MNLDQTNSEGQAQLPAERVQKLQKRYARAGIEWSGEKYVPSGPVGPTLTEETVADLVIKGRR